MLGFSVSQATVSRYLPAPSRRPGQSWRTFLRNQASAFGQYSEERSDGYARPPIASHSVDLMESAAAQIATGQRQPTLNTERINPRSAQRDRGVVHGARRVPAVPGGSGRALEDRSGGGRSSDTKSAPSSLGVAMVVASRDSRGHVGAESRQISLRWFHDRADTSTSSVIPRAFPATCRVLVRVDQVLTRDRGLPRRFHVEQGDEEIIGQRLGLLGEDAVFRPSDIAGDPNAKLWANPKNSSRRALAGSNALARYASWS